MKLLFDQNISFRIVRSIATVFPLSCQVTQVGLGNHSDLEIWMHAKENEYAIVTFDSDFYDLSVLNGHPPKVIWIRTGNITTDNLITLLTTKSEQIRLFLQDTTLSCLEILA